MEITYDYLAELANELTEKHAPVIREVMPVYPAMVGFVMTTKNGQEEFLLGCNTETGDWAVDRSHIERIAQFANTENATSEEVAKLFGEWLNDLDVRVWMNNFEVII